MVTCKDCIHYELCFDDNMTQFDNANAEQCSYFDVAELKHGKWIYGEFDIPHCSECGTETMPIYITKYCPKCGAKMDEE